MIAVAAEVDLILSKDISTNADNESWMWFDFEWEWTKAPVFLMYDAVAFSWNGDFICLESSVDADITYLNYKYGTTEEVDCKAEMRDGISPSANGVGFDFDMVKDSGYSWVKSGTGSFTLRCSEHSHNEVQMRSEYGHGYVTITGITITYGSPGINFGFGVEEADVDVETHDF